MVLEIIPILRQQRRRLPTLVDEVLEPADVGLPFVGFDVAERVLLAVDCANESRIADPEVLGRVPLSINVDHHHDNTRFGQINLIVADASSTGTSTTASP